MNGIMYVVIILESTLFKLDLTRHAHDVFVVNYSKVDLEKMRQRRLCSKLWSISHLS